MQCTLPTVPMHVDTCKYALAEQILKPGQIHRLPPALHTGAHLHGVAVTLKLRPGLLIDYKMSVTGTSDHFRHGRGPRITSCRCKSTLLASGLWESCQSLPPGSIWLFHKAIGNIKYIAHPKAKLGLHPKGSEGRHT